MNTGPLPLCRFAWAALLLLLGSGNAVASSTIYVADIDQNRGGSFWLREDGVDTQAYFAGVIYVALSANGKQFQRDSLCVDLFTDIDLHGTYDSTVLRPDQVTGHGDLQRVSWLIDNALLPTQNNTYPSQIDPADWVNTQVEGEAIQYAIWVPLRPGTGGARDGRGGGGWTSERH